MGRRSWGRWDLSLVFVCIALCTLCRYKGLSLAACLSNWLRVAGMHMSAIQVDTRMSCFHHRCAVFADSSGCLENVGKVRVAGPLPVCLIASPALLAETFLGHQRRGGWLEIVVGRLLLPFHCFLPLGICRDVEAALAPAYRLSVYRPQYPHTLATGFGCFPSRR